MNNIEIINLEQGTDLWKSYRKNYIGASEAAVLMNVSPWCTPYKLWQQKLGLAEEQPENEAMRRGKEKESIAREEFSMQMALCYKPAVIKNKKYPHLMASMDGVVLFKIDDSYQFKKGLEIKVPGKKDHESAMDGVIPEKYTWQLLQQMIVCDLQSIFYFSWNESSSKILEFSRDAEMEKIYLEEANKFWDCVQNLKEPPLTDRDYVKRDDKEFLQTEYDFYDAKKIREEAEEREKMYRNRLIELSDDQCCQGNKVRLTKYIRKGNINYAEIPMIKDMNLEPYRKENTVAWRVS